MDALASVALVAVTILAAALLVGGDAARVGIAGTLLGGVLGYLTATITERSRRRHEDAHRFEADRRAVFVRFLDAVDEAEKQVRARNTAFSFRREHPEFGERVAVPDRPDTTRVELLADEIELLAPFQVWAAAALVSSSLTTLDYTADQDDEPWHKASSELQQVRSKFIDRAKANLGTPTGVMTGWQNRRYKLRKGLLRLVKR